MKKFLLPVIALLAFQTSPAHAVTLYTDLASWQTDMGTYAETTIYGENNESISGFTTTDGVYVGVGGKVLTVGQGWATWSGGYTGQVLYTEATYVPFTLGSSVNGFGFFAEPNQFAHYDITLTTNDGETITKDVYGDAGASFFGWTGAGISSFTLSSDASFAVGDFFSQASAVPLPAALPLFALGLGGLGALGIRRRKA